MATLLDGVNSLFKRVQLIAGESGNLTSLTDSARQEDIDVAVMAWNEVIEDLFSRSNIAMPIEVAEQTITLVTGQREYALPDNLVQIRWPLMQQTDGFYIHQYEGGWEQMRRDQITPSSYTGRPFLGSINPTTGNLYLDRAPTAAENGDVYSLIYDKDVSLENAGDTMPFADIVYRSLVMAATEVWKFYRRNQFSDGAYDRSLAKAGRYLGKNQAKATYLPRRAVNRRTGPEQPFQV